MALLTDMEHPLGRAVGNALEVQESVEILAGGGPDDVRELTIALAREMLTLAGKPDVDIVAALDDGRAMDVWKRMITAQNGDPDAPLPQAKHTHEITADRDGYLSTLNALAVGVASWRLGAGRARKEDPVQAGAGITLHAGFGERVRRGQPLFTLHTDTPDRFERALEALTPGFAITDSAPSMPESVILEHID